MGLAADQKLQKNIYQSTFKIEQQRRAKLKHRRKKTLKNKTKRIVPQ